MQNHIYVLCNKPFLVFINLTDRKPNLETVDLMEEFNGCLFGLMLSLIDLNYQITNIGCYLAVLFLPTAIDTSVMKESG